MSIAPSVYIPFSGQIPEIRFRSIINWETCEIEEKRSGTGNGRDVRLNIKQKPNDYGLAESPFQVVTEDNTFLRLDENGFVLSW